ncbi:hypothetical protein DINM_001665 [Dirofilaria immitis]|nr:hypothetical protein [Dirofilaria immitis]
MLHKNSSKDAERCMLHINNSRRHPYMIPVGRLRRYSASSSSTCSSSSSEYSQPSPIPFGPAIPATTASINNTTCRSPAREAQVFERLRQLVPMLPFDRSAYQVLIETVSQVMDLEQQLEQLNEQTNSAKNSLLIEERSFVSDAENVSRRPGFGRIAVLSTLARQTESLTTRPYLFVDYLLLTSREEMSVFPDDLKTVDVTAFKRLLCSNPLSGNTSRRTHFNFVS